MFKILKLKYKYKKVKKKLFANKFHDECMSIAIRKLGNIGTIG